MASSRIPTLSLAGAISECKKNTSAPPLLERMPFGSKDKKKHPPKPPPPGPHVARVRARTWREEAGGQRGELCASSRRLPRALGGSPNGARRPQSGATPSPPAALTDHLQQLVVVPVDGPGQAARLLGHDRDATPRSPSTLASHTRLAQGLRGPARLAASSPRNTPRRLSSPVGSPAPPSRPPSALAPRRPNFPFCLHLPLRRRARDDVTATRRRARPPPAAILGVSRRAQRAGMQPPKAAMSS